MEWTTSQDTRWDIVRKQASSRLYSSCRLVSFAPRGISLESGCYGQWTKKSNGRHTVYFCMQAWLDSCLKSQAPSSVFSIFIYRFGSMITPPPPLLYSKFSKAVSWHFEGGRAHCYFRPSGISKSQGKIVLRIYKLKWVYIERYFILKQKTKSKFPLRPGGARLILRKDLLLCALSQCVLACFTFLMLPA